MSASTNLLVFLLIIINLLSLFTQITDVNPTRPPTKAAVEEECAITAGDLTFLPQKASVRPAAAHTRPSQGLRGASGHEGPTSIRSTGASGRGRRSPLRPPPGSPPRVPSIEMRVISTSSLELLRHRARSLGSAAAAAPRDAARSPLHAPVIFLLLTPFV